DAQVSVIAKKGLEDLLQYFPPLKHQFIFSKQEYKGLRGLYRFGRKIHSKEKFDILFCLPDSFSSAFMGWATGAKQRIGYKKEKRNFLLTHTFERDRGKHRVDQYLHLLGLYNGQAIERPPLPALQGPGKKRGGIVVNIHSEASSRRLPKAKAIELLNLLSHRTNEPIILIGGPNDVAYTKAVAEALYRPQRIINMAGKTSLPQLVQLFSSARAILSSDSGPAHLASAAGLPLVVLFGAGDENETGPCYPAPATVIRLGKLSCEPCRRNECKFGIPPPCLTDLENERVLHAVLKMAGQ
ncbi:MAG: glycosyltransferase family 9 protein, partial [Chitinophagaceae bacterium]|nr:glycosyltransferase family 9 protein [Chitinophagaceae bacterium]